MASAAIECGPNQYKVRAHPVKGYVKADGTAVKASFRSESCRDKSEAYLFWNDKIKNGRPDDWPNASEKSVDWSEEERERLLEALERIPKELWMKPLKGFYRMRKSKDFPNPASALDGSIVLYDSVFEAKTDFNRIIFHELVHVYYRSQSSLFREEYGEAAGWSVKVNEDRTYTQTRRKSGYVQEDGKLSIEEDFANNLEFLTFDESMLKKETPAAHDWLKKRYGDKMKLRQNEK